MRFWVPLVGMTLSTFVFNTSEFMPIGLLTDIAADFNMTESAAGMLISVYAWAVMILSLPLMLCVTKVPPKRLLLGVIVLFGICQLLSAASVNFWMLMAARIGVAAAHAVFWSIITPLAVRVAPSSKASLALSMVGMGTSVAMIFGLPCGRMFGLAIGWRATFLTVGIVSFAIVACLAFVFPKLDAGKPFTLGKLPSLLRTRSLLSMYLVTIVVITAYFTGYGYIEPFFQQVAGLPDDAITFALVLFGAAGLVGRPPGARDARDVHPLRVRRHRGGAFAHGVCGDRRRGRVVPCVRAVGACGVAVQRVVQRRCHQVRARGCELGSHVDVLGALQPWNRHGNMAWRYGYCERGDRAHRVCGRRSCAGGACLLLPALCGALASSSSSVDRVASICEIAPGRGGVPRAQTVLAALRNCARGTPPRPGAWQSGSLAPTTAAAPCSNSPRCAAELRAGHAAATRGHAVGGGRSE